MRKFLLYVITTCLILSGTSAIAATKISIPSELSKVSQECIDCHSQGNVNIYQQWGYSKHFGANVGCYECHEAKKGDADVFEHEGHTISVIVSPADCARCHEKEADEFKN